MSKFIKLIMLLILIFIALLSCKVNNYTLKKTFESNSQLAIDNLGNIYTVVENKLTKKNINTDSTLYYANLSRGNISSIDTRNSMQIMAFYADFQEIAILDNSLAEISQISLDESKFGRIDLACLSNRDNSFWLFSAENQKLVKVDKNLNYVNLNETSLRNLNKNLLPIQMIENNNFVYLLSESDEKQNVIVFDLYGNYYKTIPLAGAKRIKVSKKGIFYQTDKELVFYNFLNFDKTILLSLKEKLDDFDYSKNGIIGIFKTDLKTIYKSLK